MTIRMQRVDLPFRLRLTRYLFSIVWLLFCRLSPRFLHGWRRLILKLFGADLHATSVVYPAARVWAPWNLTMKAGSTISDDVDVYCVDKIEIGENATISQYSFLCTASHDYSDPGIMDNPIMVLVTAPIKIGDRAWVAADAFIAPGVEIGEGAVILARSSVFKDIEPWTVVTGNPAEFVRRREIRTMD